MTTDQNPSGQAGSSPADYPDLLAAVKERVRAAQYAALKAVNTELVGLYWDIGRMIVQRQAGEIWGKSVVQQLAGDLRREFPGVGGFSASNLWRMKSFFDAYQGLEKLAPLVREIGWSHNIVIMERCADPLEREFYLRMTRKFGWSKSVLIHQIANQSYEKSLLGQTNFDQALSPQLRGQAKLAVKEKNRTIVEYALYDASKPIGVATYEVTRTLPKELAGQLPPPEQIAALLEGIESP